jgi:hypothetical protein
MFLVAFGVGGLAYAAYYSYGYWVGTPTTATVRSLRIGRVTRGTRGVVRRIKHVLQRNVERRRTVAERSNQATVLEWRELQGTRVVAGCPRE